MGIFEGEYLLENQTLISIGKFWVNSPFGKAGLKLNAVVYWEKMIKEAKQKAATAIKSGDIDKMKELKIHIQTDIVKYTKNRYKSYAEKAYKIIEDLDKAIKEKSK